MDCHSLKKWPGPSWCSAVRRVIACVRPSRGQNEDWRWRIQDGGARGHHCKWLGINVRQAWSGFVRPNFFCFLFYLYAMRGAFTVIHSNSLMFTDIHPILKKFARAYIPTLILVPTDSKRFEPIPMISNRFQPFLKKFMKQGGTCVRPSPGQTKMEGGNRGWWGHAAHHGKWLGIKGHEAL